MLHDHVTTLAPARRRRNNEWLALILSACLAVAVHTHELSQDSPVTFAKLLRSVAEKLYAQNLCSSSQTHAKKQRTTTTP
jgi:hypothetical protein